MKEILKNIIKDFHNKKRPLFVKRNLNVPINSGKVISVIGSRRSGKTYFMYQIMSLLPKTVKQEDIIYINFEDERLFFKTDNLNLILEAYYELYPDNNNSLYFFFDEIQSIPNWEKFVRRLYDTITKNIFITGSSSKLLVKEIATSLRGRSVHYELFPLSFNEYLRFKNIPASDIDSTRNKVIIKNAFNNYLFEGGFPEVINFDLDFRTKTLQSYLDVMTYRDLIERYNIKNPLALKILIKKSISNVSNYLSIHKLYNELKSMGVKISKDSLYQFLEYIQDCFLLFMMSIYSPSISVQNSNEKKIYCIDNGLANLVSFKFSENKGRLLENLIFLSLKSKGNTLFYFKQKRECDFVAMNNQQVKAIYQVTANINEDNRKREVEGLLETMNYFNLKEGNILTLDQTENLIIDKKEIQVIPSWKWCLLK